MLTKKEIVKELVKLSLGKYLSKISINDSIFKKDITFEDLESPTKKIKNGIYTYGSMRDSLGDYFIFIDSKNEGFIWIESSYREEGSYVLEDFIFTSKKYKDIHMFFNNTFEISKMREFLIYRYRNTTPYLFIPYNKDNVLSYIRFTSRGNGASHNNKRIRSITKSLRVKTIGLLAMHLIRENKCDYNLILKDPVETISNKRNLLLKEFNEKREEYNEENYNLYLELDINFLISIVLRENIEYIVTNNIRISSIFKLIIESTNKDLKLKDIEEVSIL